jgi:ABC-2 type transport system permease protein
MIKAIRAEIFKFYFDIKRYIFNYIVGLISTSIFLGGIYWAINSLFLKSGYEIAFIGLLLWLFASSSLYDATTHLAEEKYLGTLERISIVKTSIIEILIARFFVSFLFTLIRFFIIGFFLYIIFHPEIKFLFLSWKTILIVSIVSILIIITLYSFGLFIASLSLIFKKVGALASVLEYLILFFSGIIVPYENMPHSLKIFSNILPMTWGIRALANLQNKNFSFCFFSLLIYTFILTMISIIIFNYALYFVKKKGEYAIF